MGNYLDQLGQQLGTGIANNMVGTGMGLLLEGHNDRRQRRQQQAMNDIENARAKEMVDYNMARQLEMWKATSYSAQVEQMKKAGLNPALMYGMSGGGGQTTGNTQGGSAGPEAPKGGAEIINAMGIQMQSAQLSLLQAQKANIDADTANKKGDAANKPIVGKNIEMNTASLAQGIENAKAQQAYTEAQTIMQEIQNDIQGMEANDIKATIRYGMRKLFAEMNSAEITANVDKATQDIKVRQAKATLALTAIDAWLKTEQGKAIPYTVQESIFRVKKMIQDNELDWYKVGQGNRQLGQQQEKVDYDTAVPPELKEILDNIFIIPGGGATKVNPVGFKIK